MSDRERYSSIEERLSSIKQVCKGYGEVLVRFDYENGVWRAFAPIQVKELDSPNCIGLGTTPEIAINKLWELLTQNTIKISYPNQQDRFLKWDGMRWFDLGVQ